MRPQTLVLLAALWMAPSLALPAPRAGVAAAVRGAVTLDRSGSVGVRVATGSPIFIGDQIQTGDEGGLQILLLDETVFTLGPNSSMLIDEFVYDPGTGEGSLDAELVRGAFRFISGRIAKSDPESMKVKLPSGTIGIRGTIVDTQVDPTVGRSLIVLSGPGQGNRAGAFPGEIRVSNAGTSREVARSGWGVEIPSRDAPPSLPFVATPEMLGGFQFEVSPQGSTSGSGGDPGGGSPQGNGGGPGDRPGDGPRGSGSGGGDGPNRDGPNGGGNERGGLAPGGGPGGLLAGPLPTPEIGFLTTTFEGTLGDFGQTRTDLMQTDLQLSMTRVMDLASFSQTFNGHFFYGLMDLPLQSGMGSIDLFVDLDFGVDIDQVAVDLQGLQSSLLSTMGFGMGGSSVAFTTGAGGLASYTIPVMYNESGSLCMPCNATVKLDFVDVNGMLARRVKASVDIVSGPTVERTIPIEAPLTTIAPPSPN